MKIKRAYFIGYDGLVKTLPSIEGKELDLKDLYILIGNDCSMIEHVSIKKGVDMWVDEEGLLKKNWLNKKATLLYQDAYKNKELGIVGNAILTDNTKDGFFNS